MTTQVLTPIGVANSYFSSLEQGDLETLSSLFDDDITWHQPGQSVLSGVYQGKQAVFELFGKFMELSAGSFKIDRVGIPAANSDLVSVPLHFKAERGDLQVSSEGIDLFRVMNGKIKEAWLFTAEQVAEDAFWAGAAA